MSRTRLALFAGLIVGVTSVTADAENWPQWRGPQGDGVSREKDVPTVWNGVTGENVLWKVKLPGWGHSSPVVWEDRVFVTACEESGEQGHRLLLCLDRDTGALRWKQVVLSAPLEKKHQLNSFASGTPATDGETVYVTFLAPEFHDVRERTPGEMVVAAYDWEGKPRWQVKPGRFASVHGYCSSPVLFEDKVIVNGDHDGDGFLVALDRRTGREIWKIARPNNTRSYVTPIIRELAGRTQLILSGSKCVTSYDPRDGSLHWMMDGPTEQFVASLVDDGELLFLTAGFPEHHLLAIRPDGRGNVTDTHIVWRETRGCSYVPSPIVVGEYFLIAADNGPASCFVAKTGERLWMERLGKHYSASLTAANGLVYFLADDGVTKVVRPGPELDLVAENPLGENAFASPAFSQGRIFLRGEQHLFCIGERTASSE